MFFTYIYNINKILLFIFIILRIGRFLIKLFELQEEIIIAR